MKFAIDAGHGNNTPGKRSPDGTLREFHFNNPTALELTRILRMEYGQDVINPYDVTGITDTPLSTRTQRANVAGVDVFISIHANASGTTWSTAEGIETFVYDQGEQPGSMKLAANVQTQLVRDTGRKNRGVKRANFAVLRETNMPAILIECGFMTNKTEYALLKSEKYQHQVARSIATAIAATYNLKKLPSIAKQPAQPAAKPATTTNTGGTQSMTEIYNPGPTAKESTMNVLKEWEKHGLLDTHRKNVEKGTLTASQAVGLLYVAIERGYLK